MLCSGAYDKPFAAGVAERCRMLGCVDIVHATLTDMCVGTYIWIHRWIDRVYLGPEEPTFLGFLIMISLCNSLKK